MSERVTLYVASRWGFAPLLGGDEPRREGKPCPCPSRQSRLVGRGFQGSEPHPCPSPRGRGSKAAEPGVEWLNARASITCADPKRTRLVATADDSDRAHRVVAPDGRLLPARAVANATPRVYPRCAMMGPEGRQVEFGSVYEQTDRRAKRLAEMLGEPVQRGAGGGGGVGGGLALEKFERRYGAGAARRVSRYGRGSDE